MIGLNFSLFVFRHHPPPDPVLCLQVAQSLLGQTTYLREAHREDAPFSTDCLTSIWYIFQQCKISLPICPIGNLPRLLIQESDWRPLTLLPEDMQIGDLLFVKNRNKPKLVAHVAMSVNNNHFFHCSNQAGTALIEEHSLFLSHYVQHLSLQRTVHYIDPRDQAKRHKEGGIFLEL